MKMLPLTRGSVVKMYEQVPARQGVVQSFVALAWVMLGMMRTMTRDTSKDHIVQKHGEEARVYGIQESVKKSILETVELN